MMPELPEVETLCRQLNEILPGEEILAVDVLDSRLGQAPDLAGKRIARIYRRGKYIQIETVGGPPVALHLRMTGRLLWEPAVDPHRPVPRVASIPRTSPVPPPSSDPPAPPLPPHTRMIERVHHRPPRPDPVPPHTRMIISFRAGRLALIDPRRFATFCAQEAAAVPAVSALAPPLANPLEALPARRLREIAGTRRLPVKSFLMDQRFIAGIGNIYACEILHHAAVDPRRPAGSLTAAEWRRVEKAAAIVLPRAVACRGTTVSDWRDLFGASGTNQDHLEVYSRSGETCRRCGGIIERTTIAGRGTFFCPTCQK